ncbi:MAG: RimK family alpha-L-glutamate ligase [Verrucomicrobiae bacterium]|nr:RimK family alpha-L-glutamate ligase [Verrucomicrobiae bacterium]
MKKIIVVDRVKQWQLDIPGVEVVSARDYLTQNQFGTLENARVFNLCNEYAYQTQGYYVSLLAEARGHRPLPTVSTLRKIHGRLVNPTRELHTLIQRSLADIQSSDFTLSVYFTKNLAKRHDRLSMALFHLFPAPLLRALFVRADDGIWRLRSVNLLSAKDIPESHQAFVQEAAKKWFARPKRPKELQPFRYTLGVLVDPDEKMPPSDAGALKRLVRAAEKQNIGVEFLEPDDISDVEECDALFIRATTSVENFTFRFARRAVEAGIPVIDDPDSILRCTNKVFLAELFERYNVGAPRTEILFASSNPTLPEKLGFPIILKQPDSSFSQGVVKVEDEAEFREACKELFEHTDLLIAQEFLPTPFDWRIGILDGAPLYACRYYMARGHWQIYDHDSDSGGGTVCGNADTLPVEAAPPFIVETALKAAKLIGTGLYGVDLKEVNGRAVVIEINDNPSIDSGVEDAVLKDKLYDTLIQSFTRRLEERTGAKLD